MILSNAMNWKETQTIKISDIHKKRAKTRKTINVVIKLYLFMSMNVSFMNSLRKTFL